MLKAALITLCSWAAVPAAACVAHVPLDPDKMLSADTIVTGRTLHHRLQETDEGYPIASFGIVVDGILRADPASSVQQAIPLPVHWEPYYGTLQSLRGRLKGRLMFALDAPARPDGQMRLKGGPCGTAYVIRADSELARAFRQVLDGNGDAETEWRVLREFLYGKDGPIGLY